MKKDNIANDKTLFTLMSKSMLEISDPDFDDKVIQRVKLAQIRKYDEKKNLRLSWLFLIFSAIILPLAFPVLIKLINMFSGTYSDAYLGHLTRFTVPAGIVLISIIVLVQIDNLIQLNIKRKMI